MAFPSGYTQAPIPGLTMPNSAYSNQAGLSVQMTDKERAADKASAQATIYELDQEISRARANGKLDTVAILTAERERIAGQQSATSQIGDLWDSVVNAPRILMDKTTGVDSSKPEEAGILDFFSRGIASIGVMVLGIAFVILALMSSKSVAPVVTNIAKGKA